MPNPAPEPDSAPSESVCSRPGAGRKIGGRSAASQRAPGRWALVQCVGGRVARDTGARRRWVRLTSVRVRHRAKRRAHRKPNGEGWLAGRGSEVEGGVRAAWAWGKEGKEGAGLAARWGLCAWSVAERGVRKGGLERVVCLCASLCVCAVVVVGACESWVWKKSLNAWTSWKVGRRAAQRISGRGATHRQASGRAPVPAT